MDIDAKALLHPLVAGFVGAAAGLRFGPGLTWGERLFNVGCGAVCAAYISPAIGELFDMSTPYKQSGLAFFIGMFGMSIAAAILQGIRDLKIADMIRDWLPHRGGGK
jgi:hypothetical protein